MSHPYPRTTRDLAWLADNFSTMRITRGIAERLECLAAWHRVGVEAEKGLAGEPNDYAGAGRAYAASIERLRASGVGPSEGQFTFSPCCGPDLPHEPRSAGLSTPEPQ